MRKTYIIRYFILISFLFLLSCENYVTNVDKLIDKVEDKIMESETKIPFLIAGVRALFAHTIDNVSLFAAAYSDQLIFDRKIDGASFAGYRKIDELDVSGDNSHIVDIENRLHQIRYHGQRLVERAENLDIKNTDLKREALFVGYFYDGYARFCLATYFGLEPTAGGHAIDGGPFIPSTDLYASAIAKFNLAKANAPSEYWVRVANSMIAKTYLFDEKYSEAADVLQVGLANQDESFTAEYLSGSATNAYFSNAGIGRMQFVMSDTFMVYMNNDPDEAARVPYDTVWARKDTHYRFLQIKYANEDSPLILMTWQEVALMKAEVAIRGFGGYDALTLLNEVRDSHGISPLTTNTVTLEIIALERIKELFCQGNRMPDQRRFDQWHGEAGTWQYFTISDTERSLNPNFN